MNKERDIERRWVIINRLFLFLGVAMLATVLLREFLLFRQNISFFNDQLHESQMSEIIQEVDNRYEQIESTRVSIKNMFVEEIEDHVELTDFLATLKVLDIVTPMTIEEKQLAYIDVVNQYNQENSDSLFFVFDSDGKVFLSEGEALSEEIDYLNYFDPVNEMYVFRDVIDSMNSTGSNSGLVDYQWVLNDAAEPVEKTAYIKYNEDVELYIGSTFYLEDCQTEMRAFLYSEFATYYSLDDYVYVFGYDGTVLYHPLERFDTELLMSLETTSGDPFHQSILNSLQDSPSTIIEYNYNIYGEDNIKTGYIRSVDEWDLYMGRAIIEQDLDSVFDNYVQSILPGFIIYDISLIVLFLGFAIVIRLLIYSNFHDVEHMFRVKNQQLKDLSFRDQLTHLYNRQMFVDLMPEFTGHENQIAILMFDANGLKLINDTYGHKMGDELLIKLSDTLRATFRGSYIFRWGGDEFVVVIKDADEAKVIDQIDKFRDKMSKTTVSDYKISAAIGFAIDGASEDNIYEMLDQAEKMMYDEKTLKSIDIKRNMIDHLLKKLYDVDRLEQNHSENVVKYALMIGKEIELTVGETNTLRLSALLHDVGKIGISQDILLKESVLNKNEYEIIRTHSEKGYRILNSYSQLSIYSLFVLSHHEWYNGKGYPQGLKGEEIPLLSRIIAIADAFDAMVSERTYHTKKTYDEAMEEMMSLGNIQFDLDLVKTFKKVLPKESFLAMEDD